MAKIVKRRGHLEEFDERKAYASCYNSCLNAHYEMIPAEELSELVTAELKFWIEPKETLTSQEIFEYLTERLTDKDPEVGFLYETHRDIS